MLDLKGHYLNNSFLKDYNFKLILNVFQIPNVFSLNVFLKYFKCILNVFNSEMDVFC